MTDSAKIDKIYDMVFDMKTEIAKSVVHQENHAKSITIHEAKIIILEAHKNKSTGRNAVLSVVSGGIFGAFMAWVARHF